NDLTIWNGFRSSFAAAVHCLHLTCKTGIGENPKWGEGTHGFRLLLGEKREHRRRMYRPGENSPGGKPSGGTGAIAVQCGGTDRRGVAEVSENVWPQRLHRSTSRLEQGPQLHHGRTRPGPARLAVQNGTEALRPDQGRP